MKYNQYLKLRISPNVGFPSLKKPFFSYPWVSWASVLDLESLCVCMYNNSHHQSPHLILFLSSHSGESSSWFHLFEEHFFQHQ